MTRTQAVSLLIGSLLLAPATARAQVELRGRVIDASGNPVVRASVTLSSISYTVRTDSSGVFRLSGAPGATLAFTLAATGYRSETASVALGRSGAVTREFTLQRESSPLPKANPSDRVLRGLVTDAERNPLTYANIQLNGGRRFVSDDSGRFTIPVSPGRVRLIVRRIGFAPEEVFYDSIPTSVVRVQLRQVAASLPEITVSGRAAFVSLDLNGFYQRMKDAEKGATHGYFITPEDLDFRKPTQILNMAESLPAVRVEHNITNPRRDIVRGQGGCPMSVFLDGIRITGKIPPQKDDFVNELVMPSQVAAMEIYPRGVGAPPQYQASGSLCGVVLIWSK